jgi:hypothetical protein
MNIDQWALDPRAWNHSGRVAMAGSAVARSCGGDACVRHRVGDRGLDSAFGLSRPTNWASRKSAWSASREFVIEVATKRSMPVFNGPTSITRGRARFLLARSLKAGVGMARFEKRQHH